MTGKGERCKAYAMTGKEKCRAHSMSAEEKAALTAASAAKRASVREAREDAETSARLGLRALLGQRLEERADAITARLEALALSPDDQTALRGMQLWLDRVHGRAVQPTRDDTPTVAGSLAELEAMSLDELAELARGLPTDPEGA